MMSFDTRPRAVEKDLEVKQGTAIPDSVGGEAAKESWAQAWEMEDTFADLSAKARGGA
jgi:hypothetical protein